MCVVVPHILARGPIACPRCIPPRCGACPALSLHPPSKRSAVSSLVRVISPDTRTKGVPTLWKPDSPEGLTVRRLNAASVLPLNPAQARCRSPPAPIDPRAYRQPLETHSQGMEICLSTCTVPSTNARPFDPRKTET
jgi:hypothetical protein